MASSQKGTAGDSSGGSNKSLEERTELVKQLSEVSDKVLKGTVQKWTCDEIREILCSESKKELRYTGLTKEELINKLLKLTKEKSFQDRKVKKKRNSKRQRKSLSFHNVGPLPTIEGNGAIYCKNLACKAKLRGHETFCQRCSCCICHKFDDNKDPSLWLTCNSDPPFTIESCGLSCHMECAFKSEKSGLKEDQPKNDVEGCFFCVSCGKTNSFLESLKKQLMIAKEDRRVDVVCLRLLLAQKLLKGTEKYKNISEQVEKAVESLETEFGGPLTSLPLEMPRGLVNRLNSAKTVKDYCSSALELLHGSFTIRFDDVGTTSLKLEVEIQESSSTGNVCEYSIWHRKVSEKEYPKELTCALSSQNKTFLVSDLAPATHYCFKAVSFSGGKELSVDEARVSTKTSQDEVLEAATILVSLGVPRGSSLPPLPPRPPRPPRPLKPAFNSQNKRVRQIEKQPSPQAAAVPKNLHITTPLEDCVKVLRKLEGSGSVDRNYRLKFLTWFGMKATAEDVRVVETFIEVFSDDLSALAEQIKETFCDW